ncbi:MAG: hypothetical protein KAS66_03315 [Candidatus Omnitrophica bacterium]|nr:hypothetical protein [Candidatus Omnitrophota bacterium]
MKEYELRVENSYGNHRIAGFEDLDILMKFTKDNPAKKGFHYYVVITETKQARYNINMITQILEAGNRHLL